MALSKGINSYVTVAEADAYFADRLDATLWSSAAPERKAQALVTATSMLDELSWTGMALTDTQTLAFPRAGEYFDNKVGAGVILDAFVPDRIIKATYEQAYHLLGNSSLQDDTGSLDSLTLGAISLTKIRAPSKISSVVKTLVKPLLADNGSMSWWRAN